MEPYCNVLKEMSIIDNIKERDEDNGNRRIFCELGYLKGEWKCDLKMSLRSKKSWGNSVSLTHKSITHTHTHTQPGGKTKQKQTNKTSEKAIMEAVPEGISHFFLFFFLSKFYWNIDGLECCVSFRCTAKSQPYIHIYLHTFSHFFPYRLSQSIE